MFRQKLAQNNKKFRYCCTAFDSISREVQLKETRSESPKSDLVCESSHRLLSCDNR